jgi:hypothetical protein
MSTGLSYVENDCWVLWEKTMRKLVLSLAIVAALGGGIGYAASIVSSASAYACPGRP